MIRGRATATLQLKIHRRAGSASSRFAKALRTVLTNILPVTCVLSPLGVKDRRAKGIGMNGCVTKPVNPSQLRQVLLDNIIR